MKIRTLFFLLIPFVSAAQIGAKTQQGKIYGSWTNSDMGFQMTLILNTDGNGEFDGAPIRFTVQNDQLTITQEGVTNNYQFLLRENKLTLSGGDLDQAITFQRGGSQTPTASAPPAANNTGASAIPRELLGAWSGYNEKIEFRPDGTCIFQGASVPFTVSSNQVILQTPNGNVMMAYVINGANITFTVNGQNYTYAKQGTATSTPTSGASGSRTIDQSLVGKWCYINVTSTSSGGSSSSECITLNQDGTYQYYSESSRSVNTPDLSAGTASQSSDEGTWWVAADRIYYRSPTQGEGSYQLGRQNHPKTGDPMIVIDGRTFVTFYKRPPW